MAYIQKPIYIVSLYREIFPFDRIADIFSSNDINDCIRYIKEYKDIKKDYPFTEIGIDRIY